MGVFGTCLSCFFIGITQRNNRAYQAFWWDTEQCFGIRSALPPQPANARADAIRLGCQHDPLTQPALVIGLLVYQAYVTGHNQDDTHCCSCNMVRVVLSLCQGLECLPLMHDNQLPMLPIASRPRPTRYIQYRVNHFLWYRLRSKLSYRTQPPQKCDELLRVLCLFHK